MVLKDMSAQLWQVISNRLLSTFLVYLSRLTRNLKFSKNSYNNRNDNNHSDNNTDFNYSENNAKHQHHHNTKNNDNGIYH